MDPEVKAFQLTYSSLKQQADDASSFFASATVKTFYAAKAQYDTLLEINDEFKDLSREVIKYNSKAKKGEEVDLSKWSKEIKDSIQASKAKYFLLETEHSDKQAALQAAAISKSTSQPASAKPNLKVKHIELPEFDGDLNKWNEFYSLYKSIVDTSTYYTVTEKFSILRTHLKREASAVIAGYDFIDSNYKPAYDTLVKTYENKRLHASFQIANLVNFNKGNESQRFSYKRFVTHHRNTINSLKNLKLTDTLDFLLFELVFRNLKQKDQKEFNELETTKKATVPTYDQLLTFLEKKAESEMLSLNAGPNVGNSNSQNQAQANNRSRTVLIAATSSNNSCCTNNNSHKKCKCCGGEHLLYKCDKFIGFEDAEKFEYYKTHKLCKKCLRFHKKACKLTNLSCSICGGEHNTLLHTVFMNYSTLNNSNNSRSSLNNVDSVTSLLIIEKQCNQVKPVQNNFSIDNNVSLASSINSDSSILGTVACYTKDKYGKIINLRGYLDMCSQVKFVTSNAIEGKGFEICKGSGKVEGIGGNISKTFFYTNLTLFGYNSDFSITGQFRVVNKITNNSPSRNLHHSVYDAVSHLNLADPEFGKSKPIDILLDVVSFCSLTCADNQGRTLIEGQPSRLHTKWGWVILGAHQPEGKTDENQLQVLLAMDPLAQAIERFSDIEDVPSESKQLKKDEIEADKIFESTVRREEDGRYVVTLPLRGEIKLPANRINAVQNFLRLEKKLEKDNWLKKEYHKVMQEHLELNHMRLAAKAEKYILPQHLVVKTQRSTTKLRVVFDASQETQGLCLNKNLLPGRKLQTDLTHVLMNFRKHKIVLTADMKKMYKQIKLCDEQLHLQHVFYRKDPNQSLEEYELLTIIFGQTSSPFLALKVVEHLANLYKNEYIQAAYVLLKEKYMDDITTGGESVEEVQQLKKELIELLEKGKFELQKWSSNSTEVVPDFTEDEMKQIDESHMGLKILGLFYDPKEDVFIHKLNIFEESKFTKRKILAYISGIYDILGFLAPITFYLKLAMQDIWKQQISWDETPNAKFIEEWGKYMKDIHKLPIIKIPRFIGSKDYLILVAFSDASQLGMCTIVYIVSINKEEKVCQSTILMSKTKIAPIKQKISIPKLELNGATLSVKVVNHVLKSDLGNIIQKVFYFTDSEIVLHWLKGESGKLKVFEANRISYIQNNADNSIWNHCKGIENPADLGTRKIKPGKIIENEFWFHGPKFLEKHPEEWILEKPELTVQLNERTDVSLIIREKEENPFYYLINKYSSLEKLTRVIGYALRFIDMKIYHAPRQELKALASWELERALKVAVKLSQREHFSDEIKRIREKKLTSQKINKLTPIIGEDKILRAEGRLIHAPLPEISKYPIILAKNCQLSRLIINSYHKSTLHSGLRTVQSQIAKRFYIMGSRDLIRREINKCIRCKRFSRNQIQPEMGTLPEERTKEEHVFENVFMDFAGPFRTKDRHKYRPIVTKGYLLIIVSLSIKAVHLEFVSELSTPAFLDAFGRFTARRNVPKKVKSDNGSNFKGASNELQEIFDFLEKEREVIFSSLAAQGIHWDFSPPYSPNMNGLVEAAVKAAKSLMYKVIGQKALTYEEFTSIFCRIESVLNSRPLVLQQSAGNEPDYLCPNSFIFLKLPAPEPSFAYDENWNLTCKFKRVLQTVQSFWKRFRGEYLNTLIQKQKWIKPSLNVELGDVVYMKEMNSLPLAWPIGRIVKVFPGLDKKVRVVEVKTANGIYRRPVNKLIILNVKAD